MNINLRVEEPPKRDDETRRPYTKPHQMQRRRRHQKTQIVYESHRQMAYMPAFHTDMAIWQTVKRKRDYVEMPFLNQTVAMTCGYVKCFLYIVIKPFVESNSLSCVLVIIKCTSLS